MPPERRPTKKASLTVLLVGVAIAIPGVTAVVITTLGLVFGSTYDMPGRVSAHLGEGTYIVFEKTATTHSYGPVQISRGHGLTLSVAEVAVIGADGSRYPVRYSKPNEFIQRNSDRYTASVEFTTPRAGDYVIDFQSDVRTTVMIERTLGHTIRTLVPWFVDIGIGLLVAIVGIVMFAVRSAHKRKELRLALVATTTRTASGSAPADWYPDPSATARLRYWDGAEWTDHVAD